MKRRALLTLGAGAAAFVLAGHRPALADLEPDAYVVDLPALPSSDRRPAR